MIKAEITKTHNDLEEETQHPKKKFFPFGIDLTKRNLLPDYGYMYFDHLRAENGEDFDELLSEKAIAQIREITEKRSNNHLTWSDIYTYELVFTRILEGKKLSRKVWDLRNRYRDCVGLAEYEAYLASKPPEISGQAEGGDLRVDVEFLLNKIYLNYSITPFSEIARNSISKKVTYLVLTGILIIILIGFLNYSKEQLLSSTFFMVLFAGAMGGLLSLLQRFNSLVKEGDPLNNISNQTWTQILIPAINGALFATLLYMIFIGKLIEGPFFPLIIEITESNASTNINAVDNNFLSGLKTLLSESRPENGAEHAKLIVWSFIAGFAERFVPDTLTRIVLKKDNDNKKI